MKPSAIAAALPLALWLALVPRAAAAQEAGSAAAQAGELRIVHLWSADPEAFLAQWNQPDPPTTTAPTTTRTARNRPIRQFILYSGCQRDFAAQCHLSAVVTITAPDGTPYGDPLAFDALPLSPPVAQGFGLAPNSIGLVIEDGDQLGEYTVQLAVTDEIAGVTARQTSVLEIVEAD
ncbi:hypothetical protein [Alteriqipengyuania sp. 357]